MARIGTVLGQYVSMVSVRILSEDDWAVYRDLRLDALRDSPQSVGGNLAREEGFQERHWRLRLRGSTSFVAEHDGRPLGLVNVIQEPGTPVDERLIMSLWVRPFERSAGVGGALIHAAAEWAREQAAARLCAWVAQDDGKGQAVARRKGFTPTDEVVALVRDPQRSERRWVLELAN